jgi:PBSX family phage terminase large subunit
LGYQIVEVGENSPHRAKAFIPRGAVARLYSTTDHNHFERMVSGPAETGKTYGWCQYLDDLCWRYAGAQYVMARQTYNSLVGTCLKTYKTILGPDTKVKAYGGERPEWFDYPNGSRLWLAGLDNPGKALSSERDGIYINQAEEIREDAWEILATRVTGRGSIAPVTWIGGDCNPGPPTHWIKKREAKGLLHLMESRHEDNPTLYDDNGNITEQGVRTIGILDTRLSGAKKLRLRWGKWVQSEGVVYENYLNAKHEITRMPRGWQNWRKICSIDFGYNNPFVMQWWAIDPDGRMYLYREIYFSRRIVEHHIRGTPDSDNSQKIIAPGAVFYSEGESYEAIVADHDAEDRATARAHGVKTTPAYKNISQGIQAVQDRLIVQGDGRPRIYFLKGCTVETDYELMSHHLPASTAEEFDSYIYPKAKEGRNPKDLPIDENNHGMDAMRYAVAYEDIVKGKRWRSSKARSGVARTGSNREAKPWRMAS